MSVSKRTFLKLLAVSGIFYLGQLATFKTKNHQSLDHKSLDDDYLIVNGWVMLKSDITG
ncbi:MAG: hypothetical protein SFU55_04395 [Methylophilus sp.]|nr:hypothetical protein [Methylophilus sp.]